MSWFRLFIKKKKKRRKRSQRPLLKKTLTRGAIIHHFRKERQSSSDEDGVRLRKKRKLLALRSLTPQENAMKTISSTKPVAFVRNTFANPQKTPTCIRRDLRKRFMFASGMAGKIKVKQAKWVVKSKVRC